MAGSCRLLLVVGLAACRDEPTRGTAPVVVETSLAVPPGAVAGTRLLPSPTFVVRSAEGRILANVPVTIAVTAGDGQLQQRPLRTSTVPISVGDWTLDTIAGVNEITIRAGSAPPARIAVTGYAGASSAIVPNAPSFEATAGELLDGLTVRVVDRHGNPVRSAAVDLAVAEGGGEVSPSAVMTGDDGVASGIAWRMGRAGGPQRLTAVTGGARTEIAAYIRSGFQPSIRFFGTVPSPEIQAAFAVATDRIHAAVIGDAPDVPVLNYDMSRCGIQAAAVTETIDDLLIFAQVTPIDGVGRVLASAGPCVIRTQSRFPLIGVMRFDADDLAALAASGRLPAVVLHEMMHVIGIGTLWRTRDLLFGSGSPDPRFSGTLAGSLCIALGGASPCADGRVPVENTGGSGTAESHWREVPFDREVMTGFVESDADMPLSAMTLGSLTDLGYAVNLFAADPYRIEAPAFVAPRLSAPAVPPWEVVTLPLFEITATGWLRRLR